MDQVVGCANAGHSAVQGIAVEQVASHYFGSIRHFAGEVFRPSCQAADRVAARFQHFEQSPTNVAGGAGEENAGGVGLGKPCGHPPSKILFF